MMPTRGDEESPYDDLVDANDSNENVQALSEDESGSIRAKAIYPVLQTVRSDGDIAVSPMEQTTFFSLGQVHAALERFGERSNQV